MTSEAQQPFWHGMVAGGSSGVVSRLVTYPPDTVKSRLQVQGTGGRGVQYSGTLDAFARILRAEGVPGFYRGFGAILLTVVPANMSYFSGYELGKRVTPRNWGTASDLLTACIAQTVAGFVFCPIDIVKQRVQTASVVSGVRITAVEAARSVWAQQGLKGFYRGYWAMNALWMPWNAIYLPLYEASKRRIYYLQLQQLAEGRGSAALAARVEAAGGVAVIRDLPMSQVLPAWAFPLCSSSCAAIAAVATHPVDVVKTRLQVLSAAEPGQRRTALGVARQLHAAEGARGFTRGMAARVTTLSVGSTISWFVYEMVKRQLAAAPVGAPEP